MGGEVLEWSGGSLLSGWCLFSQTGGSSSAALALGDWLGCAGQRLGPCRLWGSVRLGTVSVHVCSRASVVAGA